MMMIFCASFDADDDGKKKVTQVQILLFLSFPPLFFFLFFSFWVCLFRVLKTKRKRTLFVTHFFLIFYATISLSPFLATDDDDDDDDDSVIISIGATTKKAASF